jgi:cell division septum initiation protein DivIVA
MFKSKGTKCMNEQNRQFIELVLDEATKLSHENKELKAILDKRNETIAELEKENEKLYRIIKNLQSK